MRSNIFFIIALYFFAFNSSADELAERNLILHQGQALFQSRNFSEIERLSKYYDDSEAATSGGGSKSNLLDDGISRELKISEEDDIQMVNSIVKDWLLQHPKSPYAHNAFAASIINTAFFYRGGKYYSKTPSENIKKFNEGVMVFDAFIDSTSSNWEENIRWCIRKIQATYYKGSRLIDLDRIVDQCSMKFKNPERIYQMALASYSPLWSGSAEALDGFVWKAVRDIEKKRGYKEGRIAYASMYEYFARTGGGYFFSKRLFNETKANWRLMSEGLKLDAEKYPGAWKLNKYAAMACIAGDKDVFNNIVTDKSFSVVEPFWEYIRFDQCKNAMN